MKLRCGGGGGAGKRSPGWLLDRPIKSTGVKWTATWLFLLDRLKTKAKEKKKKKKKKKKEWRKGRGRKRWNEQRMGTEPRGEGVSKIKKNEQVNLLAPPPCRVIFDFTLGNYQQLAPPPAIQHGGCRSSHLWVTCGRKSQPGKTRYHPPRVEQPLYRIQGIVIPREHFCLLYRSHVFPKPIEPDATVASLQVSEMNSDWTR